MAACARCNGNQPIGAFLDGFFGETIVDHIMQHDAAIAVHHLIDPFLGAQRGDDNWHLVLHTHVHVVLQARVGAMHDLVHGKGCRRCIRISFVIRRQFGDDPLQPLFENRLRARIERGERPYYSCFALGDHQIRVRNDEEGSSYNGES